MQNFDFHPNFTQNLHSLSKLAKVLPLKFARGCIPCYYAIDYNRTNILLREKKGQTEWYRIIRIPMYTRNRNFAATYKKVINSSVFEISFLKYKLFFQVFHFLTIFFREKQTYFKDSYYRFLNLIRHRNFIYSLTKGLSSI